MIILDIDMDYFLYRVANFVASSNARLSEESYPPWEREKVIEFLENNLGLSKNRKIPGKIITNHDEAILYWQDLIDKKKITVPFEVIHVDSHADLGCGETAWSFIFSKLLSLPTDKRAKYKNHFDEYNDITSGNFLLFAIAFRWISKLTYIYNPLEDGMDYVPYCLKNGSDRSTTIQLPYNSTHSPFDLNDPYKNRTYYSTSVFEPEVPFIRKCKIEDIHYTENFDFITFSKSPNFTPASSDFIIDTIKDYLTE